MLIIGHRGAAGLVAENTIGSFQKAQELQVDMIETDLRRRFDGEIILNHNFDLKKIYPQAPKLKELLQIADRPLNLEIKEVGFEAEVLEAIKNFPHKVLITSWNPRVLKKIRALDGNIELGLVIGHRWGYLLPVLISNLKNINVSWVTLDQALVSERLVDKFHELNWKVNVYTNDDPKMFNDKESFERLKNLGINGIFTDYPDIVSKFNQI
jgi:glycerophosphoryl diester phosphodiesterase